MLWEICLTVFVTYCLILRWQSRHLRRFANQFKPSMLYMPILGHVWTFVACKNNMDRWRVIQMNSREALSKGGVLCVWLVHRLYLYPAIVETVLKACLNKDYSFKAILDVTGNSTLIIDAPAWRNRRNILVPFFKQNNLNAFMVIFSKHSAILIDQLQKYSGTGIISTYKYFSEYSIDSVSETILGVSLNSQQQSNHPFIQSLTTVFGLISERIMKPWLHLKSMYRLTYSNYKFTKNIDILYNYIDEIINTKRKELANQICTDRGDSQERIPKSFLELMLKTSEDTLGYIELREEMFSLLVGGTDLGTTAVGLSFTLALLARHPEEQEKVLKELYEVFGTTQWPIGLDDLPRLQYLEAVIKESLRLYPPLSIIIRRVDKDVTLPSSIVVPKGVNVLIDLFATHRNTKYWGHDAEIFKPERFLDNSLMHPAAFLAFSYKPRGCVASRFAMMSMETTLVGVLRRFRVLPASASLIGRPLNVKYEGILRDIDNFTIILENRR